METFHYSIKVMTTVYCTRCWRIGQSNSFTVL